MTGKTNSIAAVACQALGIERSLLPERLRSRLNYYVKDKLLKEKLLDEQDINSEAVDYVPKPIKPGNHVFIRNLVILDTLFEDKKLIVNWLNAGKFDNEVFNVFKREWRAKKILFDALDSRVNDLNAFLIKDNINWSKDEIPYPFENGNYSAVEMIADSIEFDSDPSIYDLAIKTVINNQFSELGSLIEQYPNSFITTEMLMFLPWPMNLLLLKNKALFS